MWPFSNYPLAGWVYKLTLLIQSSCCWLDVLHWSRHVPYVTTISATVQPPRVPSFGWKRYPELGPVIQNCFPLVYVPPPTNRFPWKWDWPLGDGGRTLFAQPYPTGYDLTLWEWVSWGNKDTKQDFAHFKSTLRHGIVNQLLTPDRTVSYDEQIRCGFLRSVFDVIWIIY